MPDLTIKPVAAAGNKLILQDQAGGAVLTTADSGATVANATLTTPTIANMANCTFPAGHILQVLSTVKTDTQSYHNNTSNVSWQDITGLSRAITPASTSNKILINFNISYGSNTYAGFFKIQRKIGSGSYADLTGVMGNAEGNRSRMTAGAVGGTAENEELSTGSMMYLDSPNTTSEVTYKMLYTSRHNDYMYINRTHAHTNADYAGLAASTITCMEVAG